MRAVYVNQTIDLMPPTNIPMTRWGFQTSSLKYSKTAAKKVSCLRFLILWKSHFSIYKNAQNPQKQAQHACQPHLEGLPEGSEWSISGFFAIF
jgi:hypothetical protein